MGDDGRRRVRVRWSRCRAGYGVALLGAAVLALVVHGDEPSPAPPVATLTLRQVLATTLALDPNLDLARNQVRAAEGSSLVAASRFEPILSGSLTENDARTPTASGTPAESSTLRTRVDLDHELRTGLRWAPSVVVERTDAAGLPTSTATVAFAFTQPLLRDRGRDVTTADERAATHELAATRFDLAHRTAQRLQAVTARYWSMKAAALDLAVLVEAETRSRELLETTRRLVASDVTPAADLVQLEADATFREAARIAGERVLFAARQDLGREMGLDADAVVALPVPSDPFPEVADEGLPSPEVDAGRWIGEALDRRADLRADRERLAAAHLRQVAADNALLPRLDLVFTPSYTGRSDGTGIDGTVASLIDDVPGLSTLLGIQVTWPTANRRARGLLLQAEAAVEAVALNVELTSKAIGADVPAALDAVRQRAHELSRFRAAVGYFQQALDNEIKKLRAGSSTLIDVLAQRDRLTSVQRTEIAAFLGLAQALADLRFQTGTLIDLDAGLGTGTVSAVDLTTVPP